MENRLEVFFGEANNAAARVYARWTQEGLPRDCRLTGRVIGPTCVYSHTLSAAVPLRPKPPSSERVDAEASGGAALLAEAVVPDPCFWTTELPFLYRVEAELRRGDEVVATAERLLGIRRLGAYGKRLIFEGRGWVARGVHVRAVPERPLAEWRAADLAMVVEQPDDALCAEASRLGVLLIAEIAGASAELQDELQRLARWPAVAAALLPPAAAFDAASRRAATNLLVGQRVRGLGGGTQPSRIDIVVCEDDASQQIATMASGITLPVMAWRRAGGCDELAEARRACDLLQRDLASLGEFAGFLV